MTKRLTIEAKNFLINKMSMTANEVDEMIGTGMYVTEDVFKNVWQWATVNRATKVQQILWGVK